MADIPKNGASVVEVISRVIRIIASSSQARSRRSLVILQITHTNITQGQDEAGLPESEPFKPLS